MSTDDKQVLGHFFIGMVVVVLVQTVFMFGGYLVEKRMGLSVTGIPSSIGLTLVLIADLLLARRYSPYVLLGSFVLAFLSPLLLLLILMFDFVPASSPQIQICIGYMTGLIALVWAYCVRRIMKGGF